MSLDFPREELLVSLREGARSATPLLLTGPPGAGKTTLLRDLSGVLAQEGWHPVLFDLMGAASSPDRFVRAALVALPDVLEGKAAARRDEARGHLEGGRDHEEAAVRAVLGLWAALERVDGRKVALLVDEPTEIRALAYFPGLREVDGPFGAAMAARRAGTILASSFATQARKLWPSFEVVAAPPMGADDLRPALRAVGLRTDPLALARAAFGWPRYLRVLTDALLSGEDLLSAWTREMSPGGRLEQACRHTYDVLLLRSRGYGMSKAVLSAVAAEEGLNLTALVARLGRTPGAVRDYLGWLLAVDALHSVRKRYFYVDGLVRTWVRLYTRGVLPREAEVADAARQALETPAEPAAADAGAGEPVVSPAASRREILIDID